MFMLRGTTMSDLKKPEKKHRAPIYDYNQCRSYLEAKYGYDERQYGREYQVLDNGLKACTNPEQEYQDFWWWVVKKYSPVRDGTITFHRENLNEMGHEPEWIRKIYTYYLDEFADETGRLDLLTAW